MKVIAADRKDEIIEYGRKMVAKNLTTGTGGNLSIYDREKNMMAITPSGIPYEEMNSEDIVVTDLNGDIVEGERKPSSELSLHRRVYERRDDIDAVVHTHSTFATVISCLGEELPPVHYMIAAAGGSCVPLAEYARYGTVDLAENAVSSLGEEYRAVLLANHGLLAAGGSLKAAFEVAETIEFVAELYYRTENVGDPQLLDQDQMAEVREAFASYGQQ